MFDKSKMYIFSKSKLLEKKSALHNYNNIESFKFWVDECDGKEVEIVLEEGYVEDYLVQPNWCLEL